MHAVLVTADVEAGREGEALDHLRANVVPAVKESPGLVSGYWLASGLTVLVFETEEEAQGAATAIPNTPRPDFVTVGPIEVVEVLAYA